MVEQVDLDQLTDELQQRSMSGRILIGIAGAPGAGKSTLAAQLTSRLNRASAGISVAVGMDGFHLAASVIAQDERRTRRGAPDTFDPLGYAALLARLRRGTETVFAPEYRRELEDPVAGAVEVPPSCRIVITEGNYLLLPGPAWRSAREQLDEVWYLRAPSEAQRVRCLEQRHERHGKSVEQAHRHVREVDQTNARLIEAHSGEATRQLSGVWAEAQ